MNIIIYILIFIIGTLFGSFFSLAVYRIPLKENITHKHSFCPNCNHKLGFLDLIPIFSYIFLGGKCRYCKQKIKPRYILLETLSGLTFVLFAVSLNLDFYNISIQKVSGFILGILYFTGLFIIAGIDKEKNQIQTNVLIYGIIIELLYMIYLYTLEKVNIYGYVIYISIMTLLIAIDIIYFRKKAKSNYIIQVLILLSYILTFCGIVKTITTIIFALCVILIKGIISNIKKYFNKVRKDDKNNIIDYQNISLGFFICTSNIIIMIITNLLSYIIKI